MSWMETWHRTFGLSAGIERATITARNCTLSLFYTFFSPKTTLLKIIKTKRLKRCDHQNAHVCNAHYVHLELSCLPHQKLESY